MRVRFTRSSRRLIGQYEWSAGNGYVCEVTDPDLLQELFTNPAYDNDFVVADDEPLARIAGSTHGAQLLVVYGRVASIEQLANLTKEEANRLAAALVETPRTVNGWIEAARQWVGRQEQDAEETAVPPKTKSMEVD